MPDSPPTPAIEHFKSWLLCRVVRAVEAGEVSADLLTELQAKFAAARGAATILYPTMDAGAQEARIELRDPVSGIGCRQVVLRPVSMRYLSCLISGNGAQQRERRQYAQWLAFGGRDT